MGWPKIVVLVRHAESAGNKMSADERAGFSIATHAYPLTALGREQAIITGVYCRERFGSFDVNYVSYYRRSIETHELGSPGVRAYEDFRLAEAQRGIWHNMTRADVMRRYPEEILRKEREGRYHYRPIGGENWPDVEMRIHSFLTTLARDYEGMSVRITGHGHWMILFQKLMAHFSIEEAIRRYDAAHFANASVTVYAEESSNGKSRLILKDENIIPWQGQLDPQAFSDAC